jgi:cytochrome o ubiquinol oxidase operon protein cyoD
MEQHHDMHQPDYGTAQKKLGVYAFGLISCAILTLIAFWAVEANHFSRLQTFSIIYTAACIQFLVQVICFLRLNVQNEKARTNVMALLFTLVILVTIIIGSLWIMWNVNYYMM